MDKKRFNEGLKGISVWATVRLEAETVGHGHGPQGYPISPHQGQDKVHENE